MKKSIRTTMIILCASLLLTACTNPQSTGTLTEPANTPPSESGKLIPHEKTFLMAEYEEDLYGTSTKQKVNLYAHEEENGMPTSWSLAIDGAEMVKLDFQEGLYGQASIKLEDITGDQRPEVLFYRYNTGSAGAQGLTVYQVSDRKLNELFLMSDPTESSEGRYAIQYLGDYKVSFQDNKTALKENIPLYKENYQDVDAELLKGISNWVDPISQYEIQDLNGDDIKEIITVQRVIGVAHVDTIGILKTTYAASEGQYKPTEQALYDSMNTLLKKISL